MSCSVLDKNFKEEGCFSEIIFWIRKISTKVVNKLKMFSKEGRQSLKSNQIEYWNCLLQRDEGKRQRLSAPTEGVPLKAPTTTYLKKWGLEKYRRPKPGKRLYNKLKSIALDDSDGPRVAKYRPTSEHITPAYKAPLLESSKVKAYKRKLEEDEELSAKILKRKRITKALEKQGVRAKYKKSLIGTASQQSSQESSQTRSDNVPILLKSDSKRKV